MIKLKQILEKIDFPTNIRETPRQIRKAFVDHFDAESNGKFSKELDKNGIGSYMRGEHDGDLIDGRIFPKYKILTLWYYPSKKIFFEMIASLEKKLKTKLSLWTVEVYNYVGSKDIEKGSFEYKMYQDYNDDMIEAKAIKVKEYK